MLSLISEDDGLEDMKGNSLDALAGIFSTWGFDMKTFIKGRNEKIVILLV